MKKITHTLILSMLLLLWSGWLMAQNFEWAAKLGGTDAEEGWSITTDASGNVYTAGTFKGTADFNPGAGVNQLTSNGQTDFFISKVNATGVYQWAVQFGSTGIEGAKPTVKTDPSGNVYLAGSFRNTVDFNPGAGTNELIGNGTSLDGFVVKLNSSGVFQWVKHITGSSNIITQNLEVDASGNAYVIGNFTGTVNFRPEGVALEETAQASGDSFVMKVSSAGTLGWVKVITTNSLVTSYGIALDASNNVYISGTHYGTVDFDPGVNTASLSSAGGTDAFVTKWNSDGEYIWAKNFGGSSNAIGQDDDVANAIAVDSDGNVAITGFFRSTADFDPGAGVFEITSNGIMDIFVSKLDVNGNFVWATALPGPGNNIGYDVEVDAAGNIYSTGQFGGEVDFDPGVDFYNLSSSGAEFDIYVSKLKPDGSFAVAFKIGSTLRDRGYGIAVDESYNIYTTGYFNGSFDFDPTSGVSNLSSAGSSDAFILKMSQPVYIPDANFKAALLANGSINTTDDGEITYQEAEAFAGAIDVSGLSISDLTGIEAFLNITELKASDNALTTVNLSNNTQLVTLWIRDNNLSTIDLGNITNLDQLFLNGNELTTIDLSDNTQIDELALHDNNLSAIDLTELTALTEISISNNQLATINLNNNPLLLKLTINGNQLTALDLSNNPLLINVSAFNNNITTVNLTGLTKVTDLNLTNNQLTTIDLSDMVKLDNLTLVGNALTTIDLTNNGTIRVLNVQSNNLTSLDISPLTNINWLYAQNNDLASITMSGSTAMTTLFLGGNQLATIDLSANTGLTDVRLMDNALISLDLTSNTLLEKVFINNNSLQSLNIKNGNNASITTFDATGNSELTCITVDDVAYAETNFTNIDSQTGFSRLCNSVNIPDANFKAYLLASAVNTVDDGEISFEEAEALTGSLIIRELSIADLTGIEAFVNISSLDCFGNELTTLDLTNNVALTSVNCRSNLISSLNVSGLVALNNLDFTDNLLESIDVTSLTSVFYIGASDNQLTSIDLSNNLALEDLGIYNCPLLTSLDLTANTSLAYLEAYDNPLLNSVNVANGNNGIIEIFDLRNSPNLTCITVDDVAYADLNFTDIDVAANFSTNCSNVANDITAFSFAEQASAATIGSGVVDIEVVFGTDLSSLTPTFTISSGATVNPASGVAQNFSSAFVYTVTAENPTEVQQWTINVAEENVAPTDITLGNSNIDENNAPNDIIGTFNTSDANASDTHSYSLITGTGDTDNASFSISGDQLQAAESFDFETKSSHSIRVQTNDGRGGIFEKEIVIDINNVENINQTITFEALSPTTFGDATFELSATATSELPVVFASSDETVATISGSTVTIIGAGTADITASQAGDGDYAAADDVVQILTVNKANQTISIEAITDKLTTDAPFDVVASASSGLEVSLEVSGPATIAVTTITLDGTVGTVTVTATQAGNSNINAADETSITFEVLQGAVAQTITFNAIEDQFLEAGSVTLSATASSDLEVTFEIVSGTATINANVVSFTDVGAVVVRANQAGNAEFLPAVPVEQTFEVITVTGFEEAASALLVYPNPASNVITVQTQQETITLWLLSIQGAEIMEVKPNVGNDISRLDNGIYFLRISNAQGVTTHKIIKK